MFHSHYFSIQKDGRESCPPLVECTFREVGCLTAVNPDEMAAHLDTQIHYHTSVSAASVFSISQTDFTIGQYKKCVIGKQVKGKKKQHNVSLNYALILEQTAVQYRIASEYKIFQSQ